MNSGRGAIVVLLVLLSLLGGEVRDVSASLADCQAGLDSSARTFHVAIRKAFETCRKELSRGTPSPVEAAHACELALHPVFSAAPSSDRSVFYKQVAQLFTAASPKCTAADLHQLGHMVSGSGGLAPGMAVYDWLRDWLATAQVRLAINEELAVAPNFIELMTAAKHAPSTGTLLRRSATDCSLPPSCAVRTTKGCRPELCHFAQPCQAVSCTLSAGSQEVGRLGSGPTTNYTAALSGALTLDLCSILGAGLVPDAATLAIYATPGPMLRGPIVALGPIGMTLCGAMLGAGGYCACGAPSTGRPKDLGLCQDHLAGPSPESDECPGSVWRGGGPETCPNGAAHCHDGTHTGPLRMTNGAGTAGVGDCVLLAMLHGSVVSNAGPDAQLCTADDNVSSLGVGVSPFTTGSFSAGLVDAVVTPGACSLSSPEVPCIEDKNCPIGETCQGMQFADVSMPPVSGAAAASCTALRAGALSGLSLVGGTAGIDTPAYGDLALTYKLNCQ